MTRLLHAPTVDPATRRLDAPPAILDQATRDLLARTEQEAHARGRAEGAAEVREAVAAAEQRTQAALLQAVEQARGEVATSALSAADDVTTVARRLAEAILGHELEAGGQALVDRVTQAVQALDHGPFTVHVAAADHDLLAAAPLPADVDVAVDERLHAGEATITGPWSGADLTLETVLDVLAEGEA